MKFNICLSFLLLIGFMAHAQGDFVIKGKVLSTTDGEPVIGANVVVVDQNRGTMTDLEGSFSLEVSAGDELAISFIGYTTQKITVGTATNVTVNLAEDVEQLEAVVVVAYGTQQKSSLTGSVSSLDNKNLDELPYSTVDQALQGKIAGVQIQNISSEVGTSPQISVRGLSSISASSSPLIVVDGFPISDALSFINPSSIESIEVLKDASSTALYGSRGANGVILVTTKEGSLTPRYTFKAFTGFKQAYKQVDVLNTFEYTDMLLSERQRAADFEAAQNGTEPERLFYSEREIAQRTVAEQSGGTNWPDAAQRDLATITNYQFDISGGTPNTKYYISSQFIEDEGLLRDNFSNRYNLQGRLSASLSENLDIGFNFRPSYAKIRRSSVRFSDFSRSLQFFPIRHDAFTSQLTGRDIGTYAHPRHFNNTTYEYIYLDGDPQSFTIYSMWGSSNNNPISKMEGEERIQNDYRVVADGFAKWQISERLRYRG